MAQFATLHVLASDSNEERQPWPVRVSQSIAKVEPHLQCWPNSNLRYAVSTWSAACLSLPPKTSFTMCANIFREDACAVFQMVKQACAGTSLTGNAMSFPRTSPHP